jgi:hypothetical protein
MVRDIRQWEAALAGPGMAGRPGARDRHGFRVGGLAAAPRPRVGDWRRIDAMVARGARGEKCLFRRLEAPDTASCRRLALVRAAGRLGLGRAGLRAADNGNRRLLRALIREAERRTRADFECRGCGEIQVPFRHRSAVSTDGPALITVEPLCAACVPPPGGGPLPGFPDRVGTADLRARPILDAMAYAVLPELDGLEPERVPEGLRAAPWEGHLLPGYEVLGRLINGDVWNEVFVRD